eukprot:5341098-Pleurochrysis_carterae.AAC.4
MLGQELAPVAGSAAPPCPPSRTISTRPRSTALSSMARPRALRTVTMSGAVAISSCSPNGAPIRRQRHVGGLDRLRRLHGRGRCEPSVHAEVGHELVRLDVVGALIADARQRGNKSARALRCRRIVDAVRAKNVEGVEAERRARRDAVGRADATQRLHGAADAAEEQPLDRCIGGNLVEHSERGAE